MRGAIRTIRLKAIDGLLSGLKRKATEARGFQQMAPHTSQWAAQGEDEGEAEAVNPELEAMLQEHREARGDSLYEKHQKALAAKGKKPKLGSAPAFSWNREEAMGATRRMSMGEMTHMIQDAQSLDSKFSRSVSKKFM